MRTAADWIANTGIGMHYFMGAVLVLAWPILFSSRLRVRHGAVHRWTGCVYVSAGFLAGIGGLSFILAHLDGGAPHVAFAIWGAVMMLSSAMALGYVRLDERSDLRAEVVKNAHPRLLESEVDLRPVPAAIAALSLVLVYVLPFFGSE